MKRKQQQNAPWSIKNRHGDISEEEMKLIETRNSKWEEKKRQRLKAKEEKRKAREDDEENQIELRKQDRKRLRVAISEITNIEEQQRIQQEIEVKPARKYPRGKNVYKHPNLSKGNRFRHPLKPWKDPESLFCDTEFLKKLIKKTPKKGIECKDALAVEEKK